MSTLHHCCQSCSRYIILRLHLLFYIYRAFFADCKLPFAKTILVYRPAQDSHPLDDSKFTSDIAPSKLQPPYTLLSVGKLNQRTPYLKETNNFAVTNSTEYEITVEYAAPTGPYVGTSVNSNITCITAHIIVTVERVLVFPK